MSIIMSDALRDVIELDDDVVIEASSVLSIRLSAAGSATRAKVTVQNAGDIEESMFLFGKQVVVKGRTLSLKLAVDKASYESSTGTVKLSGILVNS